MTHTNSDIHSALSRALQEARETLLQQAEFATAVQALQKRLLRDLDGVHDEVQSYFAKTVKTIETATQSIMSRLSTAITTVERNIVGLNEVCELAMHSIHTTNSEQNLRQSNSDVTTLQKNVGRVFKQVVEGSSELAASQTKNWEQSQDLATRLQESLGSMRDIEIRALVDTFGGIQGQLVGGRPMGPSANSN